MSQSYNCLGFKMLQRVTIVAAFAVKEELKFWNRMQLPNTANLTQLIRDMETERIGMNVEFINVEPESGERTARTTKTV